MIRDLAIQGYRCFTEYSVRNLAPVNLFVGRNNSGKTALLEAIELLASPTPVPPGLLKSLARRGEICQSDDQRPKSRTEYGVAGLFHGRQIGRGSRFEIIGEGIAGFKAIKSEIVGINESSQRHLFDSEDPTDSSFGDLRIGLKLSFSDRPSDTSIIIPLTPRGGITPAAMRRETQIEEYKEWPPPTIFVATGSLSSDDAVQYWSQMALTAEESLAVRALRLLEPRIQRVAALPNWRSAPWGRGGFLVKLRGLEMPVHIGSLGDGMWRMLCIAMTLVRAKGGVLLIDEIDTGLHYTTMEGMWEIVLDAARTFDVQVFATTHSSDCIGSLASVCHRTPHGMVSLQRIEAEVSEAVAYSEDEIWAAARHGIETR